MEESGRKTGITIGIIAGWLILSIVPVLYSYVVDYRLQRSWRASEQNPIVSDAEAATYSIRVRAFENMPQEENPTVIRVTDTGALVSFGDVRIGDIILLYRAAGLAVVYDPISRHLVNAVSVNIKP